VAGAAAAAAPEPDVLPGVPVFPAAAEAAPATPLAAVPLVDVDGATIMQIGLMQIGVVAEDVTEQLYDGHEVVDVSEHAQYFDDLTGELLPPALVEAARREEIEWVHSFGVYDKVPRVQSQGYPFIKVRWVEVDKGEPGAPEIRSRLVAREFKFLNPTMSNVFAGTPPLEALRILLCKVTTIARDRFGTVLNLKMLVLDVSRAHFHPVCQRTIFMELPAEDGGGPGCDHVAILRRTMYGTRDAAHGFDLFANGCVEGAGWTVGASTVCVYALPEHPEACGWRHGDDMVFVGTEDEVERIFVELSKKMILKRRALLGWEEKDDKHISLLNRLIEFGWDDQGKKCVKYEPDPRHVELIVDALGVGTGKSKGVNTPGTKTEDYYDERALEAGTRTTAFRSSSMRLAYLAQDLPMVQHSAHKLIRHMSKPTIGALCRLKRVARYLLSHGRWVQHFVMQERVTFLRALSDTDWAGDKVDRKSVTCSHVMLGDNMVHSSVGTQKSHSLSSGEAEFTGSVRTAVRAIGVRSLLRDMGVEISHIELCGDAAAARGMLSRRGVGRVRHLDVGLLWVQARVEMGDFRLRKVPGAYNSADLGTKDVTAELLVRHSEALGFKELKGTHPLRLRATGQATKVLVEEPEADGQDSSIGD